MSFQGEAEVRAVLEKWAPKADPALLTLYAERIAFRAALARGVRVAKSRRGTAKALDSLVALDKKLQTLGKAIADLKADEGMALERAHPGFRRAALETVANWSELLVAAHSDLAGRAPVPSRGKGQRAGVAADDKVARYCRRVFTELTGKSASVQTHGDGYQGPFATFLGEIWKALGFTTIQGSTSAQSMAKRASAKK